MEIVLDEVLDVAFSHWNVRLCGCCAWKSAREGVTERVRQEGCDRESVSDLYVQTWTTAFDEVINVVFSKCRI